MQVLMSQVILLTRSFWTGKSCFIIKNSPWFRDVASSGYPYSYIAECIILCQTNIFIVVGCALSALLCRPIFSRCYLLHLYLSLSLPLQSHFWSDSSPHYACPEVIRVRHHRWVTMVMADIQINSVVSAAVVNPFYFAPTFCQLDNSLHSYMYKQ